MGVTQAPIAFEDNLEPGDSILVMSPPLEEETGRICRDLLTIDTSTDNRVLWVTMHERPNERVTHLAEHEDASVTDAAVISIGTGHRSNDIPERTAFDGLEIPVTTVDSPNDLTQLGVEIVAQLDRWTEEDDGQIVVCFHSLSTFLQYNDPTMTFKFLHALTAKIGQREAIAHFHIDTDVHEEQTISTLLPLFQSAATFDGGEWTYRSR